MRFNVFNNGRKCRLNIAGHYSEVVFPTYEEPPVKLYSDPVISDGIKFVGPRISFNTTEGEKVAFTDGMSNTIGNNIYIDAEGDEHSYTIEDVPDIDYEALTNAHIDSYESVHIVNIPDVMYIGRTYCIGGIPSPNMCTTGFFLNYALDWNVDNQSVCEQKHNVLRPLKPGKIKVTCKIHGTDIEDTVEIPIQCEPAVGTKPITIDISSWDLTECWTNIKGAIYDAHNNGYTKCIFPKANYQFVYPNIGEHCEIPDNMIVDFSGSTLLVETEEGQNLKSSTYYTAYTTELGGKKTVVADDVTPNYQQITLTTANNNSNYGETFEVGQEVSAVGNGHRIFTFANGVRNSGLINVKFSGFLVRLDSYSPSNYNEQHGYINIGHCYNCKIENIDSEGMLGFGMTMGGWWSFWSAGSKYNCGRVDYKNLQNGRYVDGVYQENTNWICCKELIPLGFDYDYIKDAYVGQFTMWNPMSARLYSMDFFDEDKNYIGSNNWKFWYDPVKIPEGTAYFNINVNQHNVPTTNNMGGDDYCVCRIGKCEPTKDFVMKNVVVHDNQSGMLSVTGFTSHVLIENCAVASNGRKNGWALDYEDGWMAMGGLVVKNCIIDGLFVGQCAQNAAIVGGAYNSINLRNCCMNLAVMGVMTHTMTFSDNRGFNVYDSNKYGTLSVNNTSSGGNELNVNNNNVKYTDEEKALLNQALSLI